ncbi:putative carboxylic ester hydrolase [Maudiozyma humilis]|uniref:Carboxylic ester hydrolase n=1 Tax=Maudiozyma humilis TaxID=51915 RepID=A0AAV5RQG3_MAUHU|nr:putative carboxylic ester hydrolase [Kazachstania humilis]
MRFLLKIQVRRLTTQWYYASDIARMRPYEPDYKPPSSPQVFQKLSVEDSMELEKRYRALLGAKDSSEKVVSPSVQVGEDDLYTVDVRDFTISPTYWKGPTYEVRRGLWFNSNGTPLESHLCAELEDMSNTKNEVQKLKGDYPEGKYALFTEDSTNTGFVLKNLDGGKLFLNYLKSGLGSIMPINGVAVYKGEKKPLDFNKIDDILVNSLMKDIENIEKFQDDGKSKEKKTKKKEVPAGESIASNLTNWDLFENMPSIFSTTGADKAPEASDVDEDYMEQVQTHDDPLNGKRKIKDLVLCVHGIGQTLGKKYEYVNFAHTVNLLRTNIKNLYSESAQLKDLNKLQGHADWDMNSGIQVLPITWRHSIKFKTESQGDEIDNPELPSLDDITVSGILPLRKLMGDVALDVLLYGEIYYQKIILDTVMKELNDTYTLFLEKNPTFDGRVHLIGHSLGSLILFDLLSQHRHYKLKFPVSHFFSIGSPVGLIKLVERTRIGSRQGPKQRTSLRINKPKCQELYNVYHTCDPVAYRMEPLVDVEMAQFEQEYLPHWSELDGFTSKMIEMSGSLWEGLPGMGATEPTNNDMYRGNNGKVEKIQSANAATQLKITGELKRKLTALNCNGRVDYSLRPNILDVDVIAALKSHVSYFEETDIAGFVMLELLKPHTEADEISVKKT